MTRDDFFDDLNELVGLFGQLGIVRALEDEAKQKIAAMKTGGPGVTGADLQRYSDAIDWANQDNVQIYAILPECFFASWPVWRQNLRAFDRREDRNGKRFVEA
jgi:hypothetical protein